MLSLRCGVHDFLDERQSFWALWHRALYLGFLGSLKVRSRLLKFQRSTIACCLINSRSRNCGRDTRFCFASLFCFKPPHIPCPKELHTFCNSQGYKRLFCFNPPHTPFPKELNAFGEVWNRMKAAVRSPSNSTGPL